MLVSAELRDERRIGQKVDNFLSSLLELVQPRQHTLTLLGELGRDGRGAMEALMHVNGEVNQVGAPEERVLLTEQRGFLDNVLRLQELEHSKRQVPVQEPQNLCQRCVVPKLRRHMSTLLTDCPPSASPLSFHQLVASLTLHSAC